MKTMKKAAKITIKGTVQGVFFRDFIKENADKLELKGFVRNLDDGKVEIVCEGEIDNVDKLYGICKEGPKHAKIKKFYKPEEFEELRKIGLEMGFRHVEAGPLVRSSYRADKLNALIK